MAKRTPKPTTVVVEAGRDWRIERWNDTREYAAYLQDILLGCRQTADQARSLIAEYTYQQLRQAA